jgi:hypothetical protein
VIHLAVNCEPYVMITKTSGTKGACMNIPGKYIIKWLKVCEDIFRCMRNMSVVELNA